MYKKMKMMLIISSIILLTMGLITPIQAEEETEEFGETEEMPLIQLFIVTDGDFITIGDDDVIGQIQDDIAELGISVHQLNKNVDNVQEKANYAYMTSNSALAKALDNKGLLDNHDQQLVLHYNSIEDTIDKLWILRDEVVAFEGHYMDYVSDTNTTLSDHDERINFNTLKTNDNKDQIKGNKVEIDRLKAVNMYLLISLLILGGGALIVGLYVLSKRLSKQKIIIKNKKEQPTLTAYIPASAKAKKRKARLRIRKIRRNPRKSPIKAAKHSSITHKLDKFDKKTIKDKPLRIRRNPDKNPIRFMFSFFHKL